jgi:hypothetical protein
LDVGCPLAARERAWVRLAGQPYQPRAHDPEDVVIVGVLRCDQTIEHTVRFVKQTLGWTTPRVGARNWIVGPELRVRRCVGLPG